MEVERKDLFDFKVILSEEEFEMLKAIAKRFDKDIDQMFYMIIGEGFTCFSGD